MKFKDPKAEYRRLVNMEIEMRKMHKAAVYDMIFNADTVIPEFFEGYVKALEGALQMTPEERFEIVENVRAEGADA
jgi:hypothetical protein